MLTKLDGALGDMFIGKTIAGVMCSLIALQFKNEKLIGYFTIRG